MISLIFTNTSLIKRIIFIIIYLTSFSTCYSATSSTEMLKKEMKILQETVKKIPKYRLQKEHKLENIKHNISKLPYHDHTNRSKLYLELGYEYRTYLADSALHYFSKAEEEAVLTSNKTLQLRTKIGTLSGLSAAGIFPEASRLIAEIESEEIPQEAKVELYVAGGRLYTYMYNYLGQQNKFAPGYRRKFMEYDDSLLSVLPPKSISYRFLQSERMVEQGRYIEAKASLQKLLEEVPQHSNIYGKAAYQMAEVYNHQGDEDGYATYLAKAAISDLQGCVNEGWALPVLAKWLYEQGNFQEAYNYITISLADAMNGNARMRPTTVAQMFPAIDKAYQEQLHSSSNKLKAVTGIVSLLGIISIITLFLLWHQVRRRREAHLKLAQTARLQETYLGNLVSLCSSYSSRLDAMQKLVMRKLASGQTDELIKSIKSGKFADKTDDFHGMFDKTIIDLYPNFIEEINSLLRPEERFDTNTKSIPAELRIYALVRLGVCESSKIATILQYSANTIYAYRNKMRNKAINRETFENDILKIGYNSPF